VHATPNPHSSSSFHWQGNNGSSRHNALTKQTAASSFDDTNQRDSVLPSRAISAALHTPQLVGGLAGRPKIQTPHHLANQRKLQPSKLPNLNMKHRKSMKLGHPLKEKCLYITGNLGPFEIKVLAHCNCCWDLFESKVANLYVTVAVGPH